MNKYSNYLLETQNYVDLKIGMKKKMLKQSENYTYIYYYSWITIRFYFVCRETI